MTTTSVSCLLIDYNKDTDGEPFDVDVRKNIGELKEKVKEKNPTALRDIDSRRLVVWRCKDRETVVDPKNTDQIRRIFNDELAERLAWKETMVDLAVSENEILFVQTPSLTISPSNSDDSKLSGSEPTPARLVSDRTVKRLHAVYEKTWGRQWAQGSGVIDWDRENDGVTDMQVDGENTSDVLEEESPTHWAYTYFDDIKALSQALMITTELQSKLIVRQDFEFVRVALQSKAAHVPAFVITGQPGIGKTTFLLYLLLYRLQRRLSTAIQVTPHVYVVFDASGVGVFPANQESENLSPDCWALCDSNSLIIDPCFAFQASGAIIVQATSAQQKRWKEWSKQKGAQVIVMDVPFPIEIGAISQEAGLDPLAAIDIAQRWGPSTRTVMHLLNHLYTETDCRHQAKAAAVKVANDPSTIIAGDLDNLTSVASSLLFLRPFRQPLRDNNNEPNLRAHVVQLPTPTLAAIFQAERERMSNRDALQLFALFSTHSATRSAAGWAHEMNMHRLMSRGGEPLDLYPRGQLQPTTILAAGTLSALRHIDSLNSFYWVPSLSNFEGIDGVLGNADGIYTLQATIAPEHDSPLAGLRKVWDTIHSSAKQKKWHFVIVTTDESKAKAYYSRLSAEKDMTLGNNKVSVNVWACVIPEQI